MEQIIANNNTLIVDVRTPQEFSGGHVAGSVNIPLNEIPSRLDELKGRENIVFCCASGMRSGQATQYAKQQGFTNVYNGGSWFDVNYAKSK